MMVGLWVTAIWPVVIQVESYTLLYIAMSLCRKGDASPVGGGAGPAGFLAYLVRKRDSRVGVRSNAKLRNSFVSAAITGRQNY